MLWGIRAVELQAAYGLAVEGLRRQIHLGLIMPGERLMPERQLAETLGVSRVTLREALRVLQTEGYLQIKRGVSGGAFIVDEGALRLLAVRRQTRDPALTMRVMEFLAVNERMAVRLSALRRTPADLKRMRDAIVEIGNAPTVGNMRRADTLFRMAVAQSSQNPLLVSALEDAITAAFLPLPKDALEPLRLVFYKQRSSLLSAIKDRDENLAETVLNGILTADGATVRPMKSSKSAGSKVENAA